MRDRLKYLNFCCKCKFIIFDIEDLYLIFLINFFSFIKLVFNLLRFGFLFFVIFWSKKWQYGGRFWLVIFDLIILSYFFSIKQYQIYFFYYYYLRCVYYFQECFFSQEIDRVLLKCWVFNQVRDFIFLIWKSFLCIYYIFFYIFLLIIYNILFSYRGIFRIIQGLYQRVYFFKYIWYFWYKSMKQQLIVLCIFII